MGGILLPVRMIPGIAQDPLLPSSGVLVCSIRADWRATQHYGIRGFNPFMPTVALKICCPRDAVSPTSNVGTVGKNGLIWPSDLLNAMRREPLVK